MVDLDRFRRAQDSDDDGYATALREIRAGRKTSHWLWYVFPQLAGLGSSPTAREYALAGWAEAEAYLRDPVLGARLLTIAEAVAGHLRGQSPAPLRVLMGSHIDALKLVSSMTLFACVARQLASDSPDPRYERLAVTAHAILDSANAQGFAPCAYTETQLRAHRGG
jgi:uncharacterized protein (DUF1810 family)